MSSSNERKKPFLYIEQPYIEVNEANNQEVYISRGRKQRITEEIPEIKTEVEKTKTKKEKSYSIPPLSTLNDIDQRELGRMDTEKQEPKEQEGFRKVRPQFNRKRPFKELTIREKIAYIENYPSQLPPVSCFYQLGNRSLHGKLEGVSDTQLQLIQENGDTQVIEIDEILDIRLPGLG